VAGRVVQNGTGTSLPAIATRSRPGPFVSSREKNVCTFFLKGTLQSLPKKNLDNTILDAQTTQTTAILTHTTHHESSLVSSTQMTSSSDSQGGQHIANKKSRQQLRTPAQEKEDSDALSLPIHETPHSRQTPILHQQDFQNLDPPPRLCQQCHLQSKTSP
jgi:hypothetical protein